MNDINLKSEIFYVKIVDFLQQNWALIEIIDSKVIVFFIQDTSIIFDQIEYSSVEVAEKALLKNGFKLYVDEEDDFKNFIAPPQKPYEVFPRPIYSSGQYWKK